MKYYLILLLLTASHSFLLAQTLPKVTVAKFKNSTEFKMQSTDSVTDTFITLLMDSKKFEVIERERVQDLNEESVFSGKVKIDGCEYIFLNNISTMDVKTSQNKINVLKIASSTAEVSVQVNVRVVDAKTGKILFSLFGEDKKSSKVASSEIFSKSNKDPMSNELINNTMKEALKDVVNKIVMSLFPIKVINVKDGKIYINAGENMSLKVGDEYEVFEVGEAVIDVDSGLNLGAEEKLIGKIKVTDVKEKYSLAVTDKKLLEKIKAGNACRLVDKNKK